MRYFAILTAAAMLLLAGCATTIRSDVIAFHQWPAGLQDKSYVFEAPAPREDTLEYRSYLNLVRAQLARPGFAEARPGAAKLKVGMHFSTVERPVRVLESYAPMDPYWAGPGFWPGYYGYPRGYRGGYGPRYGSFYPYPYPYPYPYYSEVRESVRYLYERQLQIWINSVDGKKLYDVTVRNTSGIGATSAVMPAMVASAFANFPGQSGVPHRVDLKLQ